MSRNKIISIVTSTVIISSLLIGATLTTNKYPKKNISLLASATTNSETKAVVINSPNSHLALYDASNSNAEISSYISVGEMLTINKTVGNYYYVTVQETGAKGYINKNNAQIIKSGINSSTTPVDKSGFIINVSSLVYLRSKPDINTTAIGSLLNSTNITVIEKQGNWYKVKTNIGTGFVYSEYVGISTDAILSGNVTDKLVATSANTKLSKASTSRTQTYTTNAANVVIKTAPDWNSKSLGTFEHLSVPVKVISSSNNWDKVELSNGTIGYVPSGSIVNEVVNMNNAISSAARSTISSATNLGSGLASIITSAANVVNTFNNNVSGTATHAANNIKNINSNIQSNINSTAEHAQNIGDNVSSTIKNVSNTINNVSGTASSISNNITNTTKKAGDTIQSTVTSAGKNINDINNTINSTLDNAHQNIKNINQTIKTTNENINNTAKNINDGINSNVTSTANNINTINNDIKSSANTVINSINTINHHIANIL